MATHWGRFPVNAAAQISSTVSNDWGEGLIRSWNDAGWIDLPRSIGAKIAPLIGASPANVVMADSTSVNLFKVLSAACALQQGRTKIITERHNFPTDNYIAEGVIAQLNQGHSLDYIDAPEDLFAALDDDVAVVYLTHINYRNGRMLDMAAVTEAAHAAGALMIWDLAHSTGAVPLSVAETGVDFAVGCTYSLNGGPGHGRFLYVADRTSDRVFQPLSGWFAHQYLF